MLDSNSQSDAIDDHCGVGTLMNDTLISGARRVQSHGLTWTIRSGTDDHLGPSGHEDILVTICRQLLPEQGVFVDVGAHAGLYALRLAARAAKVVAIEANAATFEVLRENVALNGLSNVRLHNLAAWSRSKEELKLYDANGLHSGGSTGAIPIGKAVPVSTAYTVTLNDLLLKEERVDLIKIDVEGAETHVLLGALDVLLTKRPVLFIEMHDVYLPDPEGNRRAVKKILGSVGYVCGDDIPYGQGYHLVAQCIK